MIWVEYVLASRAWFGDAALLGLRGRPGLAVTVIWPTAAVIKNPSAAGLVEFVQ